MSEFNKTKSLEGKSFKMLLRELADLQRKLLNLRFQKATGDISSNTSLISDTKKEIARINAHLNNLKDSE